MSLNNLKPNSNEVSAFIEEPFFLTCKDLINMEESLFLFCQIRIKETDFITIDKDNTSEFLLHEQKG